MKKPVEAKEIPIEQYIFREAWEILKTYYYIERDDKRAWEEAVQRAETLYFIGREQAHTDKLCKSITLGVMDYLDILSKERADNGINREELKP